MSFETGPAKKPKSHSPTLDKHSWSDDRAIALLRAHPSGQKINWSEAARTIEIPNKNGGQVLKEFAKDKGFDVFALECLTSPPPTRKKEAKEEAYPEEKFPLQPYPYQKLSVTKSRL